MRVNRKPHGNMVPGLPQSYVLCCWFTRLPACLSYDDRNFVYTVGEISLLTPAQLRGHQQLSGLIDACFILWHEAENDFFFCTFKKYQQVPRSSQYQPSFAADSVVTLRTQGIWVTRIMKHNFLLTIFKYKCKQVSKCHQQHQGFPDARNKPFHRSSAEHPLGSSLLSAHGTELLPLCWLWFEVITQDIWNHLTVQAFWVCFFFLRL